MEPWDGPAALAMTDGRWVCAGLDRNGLRPLRYVITGDGLLIAGSEVGMVPTDGVREKGALGPGQLLAVDMAEGTLYHDTEIKDKLAAPSHLVSGLAKSKTLMKRWHVTEKQLFSGESCANVKLPQATALKMNKSAPWQRTAKRWQQGTTRHLRFCRKIPPA